MRNDPDTVAAQQIRHMRRVGFTPDEAAAAIGWNVPAGLIGWDDVFESYSQVAREMRETLVRRSILEFLKAATGGVLEALRPADPSIGGLVKAGHIRLQTFDGFKDRESARKNQASRDRPARFSAYRSLLDAPRLTVRRGR